MEQNCSVLKGEEVVVGENEVEVVNSNSWREESTHSSVSSTTTSMHGSGKPSLAYIHIYIHAYTYIHMFFHSFPYKYRHNYC